MIVLKKAMRTVVFTGDPAHFITVYGTGLNFPLTEKKTNQQHTYANLFRPLFDGQENKKQKQKREKQLERLVVKKKRSPRCTLWLHNFMDG